MLFRPMPAALLAVCSALLLLGVASAQAHREPPTTTGTTTFAVVIDAATWAAIPDAVRAYHAAVEEDGLGTWILVDDWRDPEAVRHALRALHQAEAPLEGALLVGRIPIPMLRGAQHLTSAFKMDEERYPRQRSSVPSDRYYEDFDLVCRPLGRDDEDSLLSYFELAPESAQRIEKEIYTARLVPPVDGDEAKAAIASCLLRFVRQKSSPQPLDRALTLMGHGYVSESLDAWADARRALGEQLPSLRRPGGALVELHHDRGADLERRLLRELGDPGYDLAILHSHGDDALQFLTGAPPLPTANAQVESLRRYARSRLRRARARGESEEEQQAALIERYDLPPSWFEGAFDDELTRADEAVDALAELSFEEADAIAPGAEVIHLDACFNGNFVVRPYQAGAYLFGDGETAVVIANSVNVAQDVRADRLIGLLGLGERVGAWHRRRPHLESHLFGDPTFRFAAPDTAHSSRTARLIAEFDELDDAQLAAHLAGHAAAAVRLEALAQLARRRSPAFEGALPLAAQDPSELVRRRAVCLMGDLGCAEHLESILRAALRDPSERVVFKARTAARKFEPAAIAGALNRVLATMPSTVEGDERETLTRSFMPGSFVTDDVEKAGDRSLPVDKRVRAVRTYRLYRAHPAVPGLIALARADDEPAVRRAALEALGWFVFALERGDIVATCEELAADPSTDRSVRDEATKTARRLRTGANDALLP